MPSSGLPLSCLSLAAGCACAETPASSPANSNSATAALDLSGLLIGVLHDVLGLEALRMCLFAPAGKPVAAKPGLLPGRDRSAVAEVHPLRHPHAARGAAAHRPDGERDL